MILSTILQNVPAVAQAVAPEVHDKTIINVAVATFVTQAAAVLGALAVWLRSRATARRAPAKDHAGIGRIEKKLDNMDEKLERFVETQLRTNHDLDKRIDEVSAHVIGPDGENGLRSRVVAMERKVFGPASVGEYAPPRTA